MRLRVKGAGWHGSLVSLFERRAFAVALGLGECGQLGRSLIFATDGRSRRIADVADRGLGRLNWADSDRWPNGRNEQDSGRTRSPGKAWCARRTHSSERLERREAVTLQQRYGLLKGTTVDRAI